MGILHPKEYYTRGVDIPSGSPLFNHRNLRESKKKFKGQSNNNNFIPCCRERDNYNENSIQLKNLFYNDADTDTAEFGTVTNFTLSEKL